MVLLEPGGELAELVMAAGHEDAIEAVLRKDNG